MRLSEHKQAVNRGDPKNGIAVHAYESHHNIDWDGATVKRTITNLGCVVDECTVEGQFF